MRTIEQKIFDCESELMVLVAKANLAAKKRDGLIMRLDALRAERDEEIRRREGYETDRSEILS
jgi:hypothetical protein